MAKARALSSPAFRDEAVELARTSGQGVLQLAQDLGIAEQVLRGGMKRADSDAGRGQPGARTTAVREEPLDDRPGRPRGGWVSTTAPRLARIDIRRLALMRRGVAELAESSAAGVGDDGRAGAGLRRA